ncbi:MAG: Tfp pilus assembly protein FimT/FimU [Gemmatimonadales bacterium]
MSSSFDVALPLPADHDRRREIVGFSLVETVIVLALVAVIFAYAVPALSPSSDLSAVQGAARMVEATLSTARVAAISRGRCATAHLSASILWVTTSTCGGSTVDTVTMRDLASAYGVLAQACGGTDCDVGDALDYEFDPSGVPYWAGSAIYVVLRNAAADTVQVGQLGLISR